MSLTDDESVALAAELGRRLAPRRAFVTAAESCTGGLVAGAITAIAGSSGWFQRGFVTYSNEAKTEMLDVPTETLARHGAVSEETARSMAEGALRAGRADYAVAITGIAGPDGGSAAKPVGMVCFSWAVRDGATTSITKRLPGDRAAVRHASVIVALQGLIARTGPVQ
jgi:nicotinamide-nucleotide amidase